MQIESDLHLNTKDDSLNWLKYLTSSKELGALFIVNQVLYLFYFFIINLLYLFVLLINFFLLVRR